MTGSMYVSNVAVAGRDPDTSGHPSRYEVTFQVNDSATGVEDDVGNPVFVQVPKTPNQTIVKAVMDELPTDLPVVLGTIAAPVMRPDGSVLTSGGYDATTRLLYARPRGMSPVMYDNPDD